MKNPINFFFTILLILLPKAVCADVYEGFDMADLNSAPLASSDATRVGMTSSGWNSTWQVTAGKPFVEAIDLKIKGFFNSILNTPKPLFCRSKNIATH